MKSSSPLIKWPGGKSREIKYIEKLIPSFDRYVEPFFGGGALFFHLCPQKAIINDISRDLTDFYTFIKEQDEDFHFYLNSYADLTSQLISAAWNNIDFILETYHSSSDFKASSVTKNKCIEITNTIFNQLKQTTVESIIFDNNQYINLVSEYLFDKMIRTRINELKKPFCSEDLKENLITGITSGSYMYFRDVYNKLHLKKNTSISRQYMIANFYYIREYCYGSMFRYNSKGEFNIPYGGMSYNKKNFHNKVDEIFSQASSNIFKGTDIYCMDFDALLETVNLTENDFMFLDPPYDTDFSDYEGNDFTKEDQIRLSKALKSTKAKFILIIKNTDFIYSLYKDDFNIMTFDKTYTYNVRSRNDRDVEHLIITNIK